MSSPDSMITGGLGGIGLLVAELLAKCGSPRIVLCSRSGKPRSEEDKFSLEKLLELARFENGEREPCEIVCKACDMGDEESVAELLRGVQRWPRTQNDKFAMLHSHIV